MKIFVKFPTFVIIYVTFFILAILFLVFAFRVMWPTNIRSGLPGDPAQAAKAGGQAVEKFDVIVVKLKYSKQIEPNGGYITYIVATSVRDDGKDWLILTLMGGKKLNIRKEDVDSMGREPLSLREMKTLGKGCFIGSALEEA